VSTLERFTRWLLYKKPNWPVAVFVATVLVGSIVVGAFVSIRAGEVAPAIVAPLVASGICLVCLVATLALAATYRLPVFSSDEGSDN
jgi:hypothetical protein